MAPWEVSEAQQALISKIYHKSGSQAYVALGKRINSILECDDLEIKDKDAITSDEFELALRLVAQDIKKPKKRKKENSLWHRAHEILNNKKKWYQVSILIIANSVEICLEDVETRQTQAEESGYWNEEANQERVELWEHRMSCVEALQNCQIDDIALCITTGDFESMEFYDAVCEIPELE